MFLHLSVFLSTRGSATPPWADTLPGQTPSLGRHPPWADTLPGQTPPWADIPKADTAPGQTPPRQTPPLGSACWDTVNKRAVHILLECNLVSSIILPIHLQDPPFVFRNASESCRGNACFYGYSIDLLARVAADLGFRYTLYEVPDGRYGSLNEYTRQWDGMVNELIPGKNGLAVSSVSLDTL